MRRWTKSSSAIDDTILREFIIFYRGSNKYLFSFRLSSEWVEKLEKSKRMEKNPPPKFMVTSKKAEIGERSLYLQGRWSFWYWIPESEKLTYPVQAAVDQARPSLRTFLWTIMNILPNGRKFQEWVLNVLPRTNVCTIPPLSPHWILIMLIRPEHPLPQGVGNALTQSRDFLWVCARGVSLSLGQTSLEMSSKSREE